MFAQSLTSDDRRKLLPTSAWTRSAVASSHAECCKSTILSMLQS